MYPLSCCKQALMILLPFLCALLLFSPLCLQAAPQCPKCGNVTVPYPLSTSSSCGDQQYKVVCNMPEGELSLSTLSASYPIISTSPNSQRLVVGSPSIAPDSCSTSDLHVGGLILDPSLPFNITNSNTIFLLNCSQGVLLSALNCTSENLCSQLLAKDNEGKPCVNELCCTYTAGDSITSHKIQTAYGGCTAYVSVLRLNPNLPVKQWSYGVELEWASPLEPICSSQRDCDKLSTCQVDSRSNGSRCLCNQGYHWSGLNGTCSVSTSPCSNGLHCGKKRRAPLIAGIIVSIVVVCMVVFFFCVVQRRRKAAKELRTKLIIQRQEILSEGCGRRSAKLYTSQEMKRATRNFAKDGLLGSGGFGDVYKGVLADGTAVAVKSAKVGNIKGIEQVLNEVRILSQVNHRGLVMLLGCCVETEQPLLVYEYIPNGTLLDHLKGARGVFLDWRTRLKVAVQTAEGLAYLHSAANPPIYHCDVKSSNILLDADLNSKVSDFGLSRLAQADTSHISTCAQGTVGYLDPEYYRNYQLTAKSDVYSFGMVLLELVTSQKVIDFARGQNDVNLAVYMAGKAREGRIMEVVDSCLLACNVDSTPAALGSAVTGFGCAPAGFSSSSTGCDSASTGFNSSPSQLLPVRSPKTAFDGGNVVGDTAVAESVYKVTYLALLCLQDSRSDRPSMKEVADELQFSLQVLDAAIGFTGRSSPMQHRGLVGVSKSGIAAVAAGVDDSSSDGGRSSTFMSSASTSTVSTKTTSSFCVSQMTDIS